MVHGIKGIEYAREGLWSKESQKLHELIDYPIEEMDTQKVLTNIEKFRWLTNG